VASGAATAPSGFRGAWAHARWRWLFGATALSGTATAFFEVVLAAWLLDRTGQPGWLAAGEACRMLPILLFGSLAGVIADRFERHRLLSMLYAAQAWSMAALAVLVGFGAPPAVVLAVVFVSSTFATPQQPAVAAATPYLVDEDSLAAANAAISSATEITLTVGPALGAIVLLVSSAPVAFAVAGCFFLLAAGTVLPSGEDGESHGARKLSLGLQPRAYLAQVREGAETVWRSGPLLVVTGFVVAVMAGYGFERVLHVLVADQRLGIGADGVGLLSAGLGAGSLLTVPFSARIAQRRGPGQVLAATGVLMGVPLALLAVIHRPSVAVLVLIIEGAGNLVFEVLVLTLIQRLAPGPMLGRVFGLQTSMRAAAQLGGAVLAPVLIAFVGLEVTLVMVGIGLAVGAIAALPALKRAGDHAEASRRRLTPIVDVLARLALFEGASVAALERIASALRVEVAPAATVIIHEGDPADDLFIVRNGTFSVTIDGHEVRRLGPDDWFGEIGIVRRISRTATVTAIQPNTLWRIPGTTFLEAIEALGIVPDTVNLAIAARLNRLETAPD
jgi:predicted MFS family arabinose efflux permease